MASHQVFEMPAALRETQQSRTRHLVWPREHGAWGMLFVPLATGASVGLMAGGSAAPILLLVLAAFALFCLRTPVESLWGASPMKVRCREERETVAWYVVIFATVAMASVAGLFALGSGANLLAIGIAAVASFVVQAVVRQNLPRQRMFAQVIGAAGLTSTAAAAYCVSTGRLDSRALALWAANWMFAGDQIHFVQVRLHAAKLSSFKEKFSRGVAFFDAQFVMVAALLLAWGMGLLPALVVVAFAPVFFRGLWWFFAGAQPLSVKRLGFTELAHAISFGVLLVVAFRVG